MIDLFLIPLLLHVLQFAFAQEKKDFIYQNNFIACVFLHFSHSIYKL